MTLIKIISLFCLMVILVKAKKIPEKDREMFKSMVKECQTSSGASDEEVNSLMDGKTPESKEAKCITTCVMKQFSMLEINKNGNLMMCRACIMKMAEMNGVEKEKLEKIGEALSKCEDIKNADSCELSADISKCMKDEMEKRNIKPDDFEI